MPQLVLPPEVLAVLRLSWIAAVGAVVLLAAVVFLRASRVKRRHHAPPPEPKTDPEAAERAARRLSDILKFQTVSHPNPEENATSEWVRLRDTLRANYPLTHEKLERVVVGKYSLLYRWVSPEPKGEPLLFCAHLDVVPVSGEWTYPPFSGEIAGDRVWGRGALDCKHLVVTLLEAVERLLERGFVPDRDIWLAFGHDEEVGGRDGAGMLAKLFSEREMHFAMILDEGGDIVKGRFAPDLTAAYVAVAEKGFMNARLSVKAEGGHASTPPPHTALGLLSKAISRIEYRGRRPRLTPLVRDALLALAPELSYSWRLMLSNLWLFKGRVLKRLLRTPETAALVRTTMAPTMSACGTAANVLPDSAEAMVNLRLLHGDSAKAAAQYLRDLVGDLGVSVEPERTQEAGKISDYRGEMWNALRGSIQAVFGPVTVAPFLMCGGTDAYKYENFSDCVFRFCPFHLTPEERHTIHSHNESVRAEALGTAAVFYEDLLYRVAGHYEETVE